jgi:hypothetical protein
MKTMLWFKHLSNASDDDFIEELEEKFGWEGYGRWWKLLEIIAKSMGKNKLPIAKHSWQKWQSFLKGKRSKLSSFLVHCQLRGKIKLHENGNILEIRCDKLLELRDEYSRKSGHSTDNSQDNIAPDTDTDKEEERKQEPSQEEGLSVRQYPCAAETGKQNDSKQSEVESSPFEEV